MINPYLQHVNELNIHILEMIEGKKIVLIGPPGAGKTSIYKVYFEMCNPLKLLDISLEPTRGINSSVYSLFNSNLGILDLAGQENEVWLTPNIEVFDQSNVIICIFDVMNSLESIVSFLIKIIKIKTKLNLSKCKIFAFLHKIDLVKPSYLFQKIKAIIDFFKLQYHRGQEIEIFKTSITEDFFFDTYNIIGGILSLLFQKDLTA